MGMGDRLDGAVRKVNTLCVSVQDGMALTRLQVRSCVRGAGSFKISMTSGKCW